MPLRPISPGLDSLLSELEEPPRLPDVASLRSQPVHWWDTRAETQLAVSSPLPQQHVALDITDEALAGPANEPETEADHRAGVAEGAASARAGHRSPNRSALQPAETRSLDDLFHDHIAPASAYSAPYAPPQDAEPSSWDATTSPILEPPKQNESLRPPGRKRPAPPPPPPPLATWLAGKGEPNTVPTLLTASEAVPSPAASPSAPDPPASNFGKAPIPFKATSAGQLEPSGPISVEHSSPAVAKTVASPSTAAATVSAGYVKPSPTTAAPALKAKMASKPLEIEKATTSAKLSTEVEVAPFASTSSPAAPKLSSGASPSTSNALTPGETSSAAKPPMALQSSSPTPNKAHTTPNKAHTTPNKAHKPPGKLKGAKAGATAKAGMAATTPAPAAPPSLKPGQSPSAASRPKIKIKTTVTTVRRPAATNTAALHPTSRELNAVGTARAETQSADGARLASGSTSARIRPTAKDLLPSSPRVSSSGSTVARKPSASGDPDDPSSDSDESSSDPSSGNGRTGRSKSRQKRKQEEHSSLVEDSSWITFTLANPVQTMPRSKSRVTHTVQRRSPGEPMTLAQLPIELQQKIMMKLLEANRDILGNYHYLLPAPSAKAVQKLLQLAPAIDLAVLGDFASASGDPPGFETIQPVPTAYLSYELASGQATFVENYAYLLEGYVTTEEEAEAVLAYFEHPDTLAKARVVGLDRQLQQFSAGLRAFRDRGGWSGERKRVFAYAGWSNGGRYRTAKNGRLVPRFFSHFVGKKATRISLTMFVLRELHTALASQRVEVFATFAGTANRLPDTSQLGMQDIMLIESLVAVSRFSTVDLGSGNLAPCSGALLSSDTLPYLDSLPQDALIADVLDIDNLPASLRLYLERTMNSDLTIAAALPTLRKYDKHQRDKATNPTSQGLQRQRIFHVQRAVLVDASSPAAKPPRRLTRQERGLAPMSIVRSIDAESVLDRQSDAIQAECSPHSDKPYFPAIIELLAGSRIGQRKDPDWYGTIMTRQNIRQGIKLRFTSANTNGYNEVGTRIVACHGDQAMILMCRVSPVFSLTEAWARWDDDEEVFVVEKNGRPIALSAKVDGGSEKWSWDLDKTKEKILPATSAEGHEEKKAEAARLFRKILSMW